MAAVAALPIGGCITLLPRSDPVQAYSFRTFLPAAPKPRAAQTPPVAVGLGAIHFARAARTDRILTRRGDHLAYVADVRWVVPADVLFGEALTAAFDDRPVALLPREAGLQPLTLGVRAARFEADYSAGGAPVVIVEAVASLSRRGGGFPATRTFRTVHAAQANRVTSIVSAYRSAVAEITAEIADWTVRQAARGPETE